MPPGYFPPPETTSIGCILGNSLRLPQDALIILLTNLSVKLNHPISHLSMSSICLGGYFLSPPTRQFFWRYLKCLLGVVFFVPSNSAIFGDTTNFCLVGYLLSTPTRQFFGDFWKFCFARNFLCPPFQKFLAIFESFLFARYYLCPPILWGLLCSGRVSCILDC